MTNIFRSTHRKMLKHTNAILLKVLPFVAGIILVKLLLHWLNLELFSINAIFSGIIGANVFLLGFLLSGVISDFKESERIPGEMAAIIHTLADELDVGSKRKADAPQRDAFSRLHALCLQMRGWFYKGIKTRELMGSLSGLYRALKELDGVLPPNYIARLKQEHHNLRRLIIRAHTIRETSFISSGYWIATTTTGLLLLGLAFSRIEPFYESLFFVGVITYLMVFLILLIRDLDNPFGYYDELSSEDISLKPLEDALAEMNARLADGAPQKSRPAKPHSRRDL